MFVPKVVDVSIKIKTQKQVDDERTKIERKLAQLAEKYDTNSREILSKTE